MVFTVVILLGGGGGLAPDGSRAVRYDNIDGAAMERLLQGCLLQIE